MSTAEFISTPPGQAASRLGTLPAQIVRRELATRDAVVLWLARPGTSRAPAPYQPGQYITLALPARDRTLYRSYSLCGDGNPDQPWQIAVKRRRGGAVSSFLFDRAAPGAILAATPPRGSFTLPTSIRPDVPLILVAAGAGIAPIFGMLRALAALPPDRRPPVQLHYASRTPGEVIFARELAMLDPGGAWLRRYHYLTSRGERLTPERVLSVVPLLGHPAAEWYVCGADTLKVAFQEMLPARGIPAQRLHVESFGSDGGRPARRSGSSSAASQRPIVARVNLAGMGVTLDARQGETLLDALERQGYAPDSNCRVGDCGLCRVRLLAGRASDTGIALTPAERAAGYVLACVAQPSGDLSLAPDDLRALDAAEMEGAQSARRSTKRTLRVASAAAAIALFTGAWTLTNHKVTAGEVSASGGDQQVLPTFGGDDDNRGGSGVTVNPFQSSPNTHSGVS